jgi:hypothetical protein
LLIAVVVLMREEAMQKEQLSHCKVGGPVTGWLFRAHESGTCPPDTLQDKVLHVQRRCHCLHAFACTSAVLHSSFVGHCLFEFNTGLASVGDPSFQIDHWPVKGQNRVSHTFLAGHHLSVFQEIPPFLLFLSLGQTWDVC